VRVVLDPDLASKAIAGATRIRLRASARFSELDKAQLLQHEAFVHVGTALNGRAQPRLTSLSLGAPRTTQTQEGIAMLAELLTGSIDIQRLRLIALRVVAVQQALDGATSSRCSRISWRPGSRRRNPSARPNGCSAVPMCAVAAPSPRTPAT
jgi:hypothetical protein